jgi:hypothetical protein
MCSLIPPDDIVLALAIPNTVCFYLAFNVALSESVNLDSSVRSPPCISFCEMPGLREDLEPEADW